MKRFGLFLILLGALAAAAAGLMNYAAVQADRGDPAHRTTPATLQIEPSFSEVGVLRRGLSPSLAPTAPTDVVQASPPAPVSVPAYTVTVANTGGAAELDRCEDGFTHLVGFETTEAIKPQRVLARHNNYCGGDFVLYMEIGDVVELTGEGLYRVVDARDTPRIITPEDITGMKGSVLLQTCYNSKMMMRFVSLERLS
jgi:hypothetical protein